LNNESFVVVVLLQSSCSPVRPACTIADTTFLIFTPKKLILDVLKKYRNVAINVGAFFKRSAVVLHSKVPV